MEVGSEVKIRFAQNFSPAEFFLKQKSAFLGVILRSRIDPNITQYLDEVIVEIKF